MKLRRDRPPHAVGSRLAEQRSKRARLRSETPISKGNRRLGVGVISPRVELCPDLFLVLCTLGGVRHDKFTPLPYVAANGTTRA
jgi:hypothetical protein